MRDVAILGRDHIKVDSLDKVLGRAKFAADYYMPDMLYGGVFRSTVPHAYIKKLNLEKARALPGVAAVLDHTAIPGKNRFGIIVKDEPCLVDDKVRRYGDAIAVVAAETPEIVQEAMQLIEVEYEELPVINSYESAMAEGAICVHGTTNVHAKKHMEFGNVDEAWSKCDVIVENTYSTHVLSHMFIEPDAGIAYYDEKGIMTVIASTQNPHYDRNEVAGMLGVPQNHVRCIQPTTGGGFGGKLDIGVQLHCALLAPYTKRPVKIVRSRTESTMVSSKRHPITTHVKTGATKDGKLVAVALEHFGKGFGGDVGVMVGYDVNRDTLTGIGITTMKETPGLGTRVADPAFTGQFTGKPADARLKSQGGDIDAVSGATISSIGVVTALGNAAKVYAALKPEIVKAWQ